MGFFDEFLFFFWVECTGFPVANFTIVGIFERVHNTHRVVISHIKPRRCAHAAIIRRCHANTRRGSEAIELAFFEFGFL